MKKRKQLTLLSFVSVLLLLITISCNKEEPISQSDDFATGGINVEHPVYQYILGLGVKPENITETEDYFIAEDDIWFDKKASYGSGTFKHYMWESLISYQNKDIKVYLDEWSFINENFRNNMKTAASAAIGAYNSVPDMFLNFTQVYTEAEADIKIFNANLGGWCGAGFHPSNGEPAPDVRINEALMYSWDLSHSQLRSLITHEIGHNIGLMHVDDASYGDLVPGTHSDYNSVMIAGNCDEEMVSRILTPGDQAALQEMYPELSGRIVGINNVPCGDINCYSWEASASGGSGNYTYSWVYWKYVNGQVVETGTRSGSSCPICFFPGQTYTAKLELVINDGDNTVTVIKNLSECVY